MRIDFVIGSLQGGGAERVVCTLANYFAETGHEVRLITFRDRQDAYVLHESVQRVRYHKNLIILNFALVRSFIALIAMYRKKVDRPDIISSHVNLMGLVTIFISKLYKIKLTVSEHSNHKSGSVSFSKWFLWNVMYKFPDAVTILTSYDKHFFEKKTKKVVVMPNPCSFKPYSAVIQRDKVILAIGDLNRYLVKGFDNLLEIASIVVKKHPDWKFMIVGKGDVGLKILKEKTKALDLQNNVIFAGFRSDVQQLMQSSAIFMLTSRYEGLPMGLMEASSQGMACISFDCVSGPAEIIKDGHNGFLVLDQDNNEMTKKTNILIEDEKLRAHLSENAVLSSSEFSIEKIGEKWYRLFVELITNAD